MCYIRLPKTVLVIRFKIFYLPLSVSSCLGLSRYLAGHACCQHASNSRNSTPQIEHGIRAFSCGQTRDLFLKPGSVDQATPVRHLRTLSGGSDTEMYR
jgi:hypothetical protein